MFSLVEAPAMSTIENIYASIVRTGVERGHYVVPEFCVTTKSRLFQKYIDVVWLQPRNEPPRIGSLRRWRIVAAFEIEGYDVPIERIQIHSAQFQQLQEEEGTMFPCIVPLYTEAYHRSKSIWGNANPEPYFKERRNAATDFGGVVQVCDGRTVDWLDQL